MNGTTDHNRHGVTMIHNMSSAGDGEVFIAARTMATLAPVKVQLRIYSWCQASEWSLATPKISPDLPSINPIVVSFRSR